MEIAAFEDHLRMEERAEGTIEKYLRDVGEFAQWLNGWEVSKEKRIEWKKTLWDKGLATCTVNSKLVELNTFFHFAGWEDCLVKTFRVQKRVFQRTERVLKKEEYRRLLDVAEQLRKRRLFLLMETICATGIRVSEVEYITVEVARAGRADIQLKEKMRTILLPGKLCWATAVLR